jgi:hypothetical protein
LTIYKYLLLLKILNFVAKPQEKEGVTMEYPKEFVNAVKTEYPDRLEMHEALDAGDEAVGDYLSKESTSIIGPDLVIELIDQGKIGELKAEAQKRLRGRKLHAEWCALVNAQRRKAGK